MSRPRDIGTEVESAIRKVCRAAGFPHAERNPLYGGKDQGDLLLTPGIIIEAKGGKQAEQASDNLIQEWMRELEISQGNAKARYSFLVTKRKGVGVANAHNWWVHTDLFSLLSILGEHPTVLVKGTVVRFRLGELLSLLREVGFGEDE